MAVIKQIPLSFNPDIDGLLHDGWKWADTTLTYAFPTSLDNGGYQYFVSGFIALDSASTTDPYVLGSKSAFSQVAGFTNQRFLEMQGGDSLAKADIKIGMAEGLDQNGDDDFNDEGEMYADGSVASAGPPTRTFNNQNMVGHVFADPTPSAVLDPRGTMMHEIGHALGLKHPFEMSNEGLAPLLDASKTNYEYTIMSYGIVGSDEPSTFMQLDIQALQYLYGANYNFNGGDTAYRWDPKTGEMFVNGAGQGAPGNGKIFMTVWDGGGIDTYDFSNYATGVTVDLNPGASSVASTAQLAKYDGTTAKGNIYNALLFQGDTRSLIENAIGGSGNDRLFGNVAGNLLRGGAGNDHLNGFDGNDIMMGGAGNDEFVVDQAGDQVYDDPGAAGGLDKVYTSLNFYNLGGASKGVNVEHLQFVGTGNFSGTGNALDNVIVGAEGNDTLRGAAGNDFLIGGAGTDTLDGGAGNDRLAGEAGADIMRGGDGNDTYVVNSSRDVVSETRGTLGPIGSGALVGYRGGIDTVEASTTTYRLSAYVENLTFTYATPGSGLSEIKATGTGNALNNVIIGNSGRDTLDGAAGDDILDGGLNSDVMAGGAGNDIYYVDQAGDVVDEEIYQGAGTGLAALRPYRDAGSTGDTVITSLTSYNLSNIASHNSEIFQATASTSSGALATSLNPLVFASSAATTANSVVVSPNPLVFASPATTTADSVVVSPNPIIIEASSPKPIYGVIENLAYSGVGDFTGTGNAANNVLTGNVGNDTLSGLAGNDLLSGGSGEDILEGGVGNDTLHGGANEDTLEGGAGNDTLIGGDHFDTFVLRGAVGDLGADTIEGGSAGGLNDIYNDRIDFSGLAGRVSVDLAAGSFTATDGVASVTSAIRGIDYVIGTAFDDTIVGTADENELAGGAGNDTLQGGAGRDFISGGEGVDIFVFAGGWNEDGIRDFEDGLELLDMRLVTGLTSFDQLTVSYFSFGAQPTAQVGYDGNLIYLSGLQLGEVTAEDFWFAGLADPRLPIIGTEGDDTLAGNAYDNTIQGLGGNDVLIGNAGADIMDGGAGDDIVVADNADTRIDGGAGYDYVRADASTNVPGFQFNVAGTNVEYVDGDAGDDVFDASGTVPADFVEINGNAGADTMIDGGGEVWFDGGEGIDTMLFSGNLADYTITPHGGDGYGAWAGWTLIVNNTTGTGDWTIGVEKLQFADQAIDDPAATNNISGTDGSDSLNGTDGVDILAGGAGADELRAGANNDALYVDNADTVIDGGDGWDVVYVNESANQSGLNFKMAGTNTEYVWSGMGNDVIDLTGLERNDSIWYGVASHAGDDTVIAGGASFTFEGGAGNDRLILSGNRADYTFEAQPGDQYYQASITHTSTAVAGYIWSVETIQFADGEVAYSDIFG